MSEKKDQLKEILKNQLQICGNLWNLMLENKPQEIQLVLKMK